jgi:K+-transporting ATPase ATPase C chain
MNRLPGWVRQHIAGLRALLIFTLICGIIYPVVVWGVAQVAFHHQANGSLVSYNGRVVGSSVLCQGFVGANGQERLRLQPAVLRRVQPRPQQPGPGQADQAAAAADRQP